MLCGWHSGYPLMIKKIVLFGLLGVLLLAGTVIGTLFLAKQFLFTAPAGGATPAAVSAPAPKVAKDPLYLTIDPAFVVNIRDGARYRFLQVQVDLMSRDAIVIANVEKLMPRLKGELTMLYSALDSEQVHLPEGRQALQKNTLDLLNKVLAEETGRGGVEAVYFSKFVVQ